MPHRARALTIGHLHTSSCRNSVNSLDGATRTTGTLFGTWSRRSEHVILRFLRDLETTRRNSVRTRNARLAAIHSFFRYVLDGHPERDLAGHRVLAIPVKKATRPLLGHLTEAELSHLLTQMDRTTIDGERDYVLIALLYDTGARIQELLDLTPRDVRFAAPPLPPSTARDDASVSVRCRRKPPAS